MVSERERGIHDGSSASRYDGANSWAAFSERMAENSNRRVEVEEEGPSQVDGGL
jgi:hypothetical protein